MESNSSQFTIRTPPLRAYLNQFLNSYGLAVIVLITLGVYLRVLAFDYNTYDDGSFTNAPSILSFDIPGLFTKSVAFDYIPLTLTTYAIEHAIFGFQPSVSHGINLFLHLINVVVLFVLLNRVFSNKMLTLLTCFVFALHPMNVESVAWFSERKGLLSTFFVLLSVLKYEDFFKTSGLSSLFWSFTFYLFAILSKPVALPLPFLFLVFELMNKKRLKTLMPFFGIMIVLYSVHMYVRNVLDEMAPVASAARVPKSLWFYIVNFFNPAYLSAYYTDVVATEVFTNSLFALLCIIFVIVLFVKSQLSYKFFLASLVWYSVLLLPQSKVLFFGLNFFYSDRYFYLAGLSLIVFFAYVATTHGMFAEKRWVKPSRYVLLFAMILPLRQTWSQVEIWRNSQTLWQSVIDKDPSNSMALNNLGISYFHQNNFEKAEEHFQNAVAVDSQDAKPLINIAAIYERKHDNAKALSYLEKALTLKPENLELQRMYQELKAK